MRTVPVRVPPEYWTLSALPEGYIERWVATDAAQVELGQTLALVRVEGQQYKLAAPAAGRLAIEAKANSVVDPGMRIALITARLDA